MIELVFTGDIMLSRGVGKKLLDSADKMIISPEVKSILETADFCIGNLECPVSLNSKPLKKNGFVAHPDSLKQLYLFDLLTVSNNHIFDCGTEGAIDTLLYLNQANINSLGLVDNNFQINPFLKIINGKTLAFFSCLVPDLNKNRNSNIFPQAIEATHKALPVSISSISKIADEIFVLVHGGNEMIPFPEPSFRDLCRSFIDYGANFVITTHPHVLGGYESFKCGHIFYSLGDFIFDSDSYLRKESAILKIKLNGNASWDYIPTTINENFEVVFPNIKLTDKIQEKIELVTSHLSKTDYAKKYPSFYKSSLSKFQIDRIIYKLKKKGFLHLIGFLFNKVLLIPFYTKKILLKQYK